MDKGQPLTLKQLHLLVDQQLVHLGQVLQPWRTAGFRSRRSRHPLHLLFPPYTTQSRHTSHHTSDTQSHTSLLRYAHYARLGVNWDRAGRLVFDHSLTLSHSPLRQYIPRQLEEDAVDRDRAHKDAGHQQQFYTYSHALLDPFQSAHAQISN